MLFYCYLLASTLFLGLKREKTDLSDGKLAKRVKFDKDNQKFR